jgi:hypothetical protein
MKKGTKSERELAALMLADREVMNRRHIAEEARVFDPETAAKKRVERQRRLERLRERGTIAAE